MDLVKKGTLEKIEKFLKFNQKFNYASYQIFIIVGLIMAIGTLGKLLGYYDISSDWFWFLAGIGLIVEGTISLIKQKRFDRKYKIVERGLGSENILANSTQ